MIPTLFALFLAQDPTVKALPAPDAAKAVVPPALYVISADEKYQLEKLRSDYYRLNGAAAESAGKFASGAAAINQKCIASGGQFDSDNLVCVAKPAPEVKK